MYFVYRGRSFKRLRADVYFGRRLDWGACKAKEAIKYACSRRGSLPRTLLCAKHSSQDQLQSAR